MELTEILNWVLGGTSLAGIVTSIVYFNKTRRIKESEAKQAESGAEQSDIETQKQKIDLGNKFIEDSLSLMEKIKQSQDKGNENQDRIIQQLESLADDSKEHGRKLDTLDERTDKMELRVSDIVTYLNGDFQDYLKRHTNDHK